MCLTAIEEHFQAPALKRLAQTSGLDRAMGSDNPIADRLTKLNEVGAVRLGGMYAAGVDFQVLSQTVGRSLTPIPNSCSVREMSQ